MGQLSWLSHSKEARTSLLLNGYLLVALLLAAIRTRTAWLVFGQQAYTNFFTIGTALLGLIAILEALPKRHWSKVSLDEKSPEDTSGLYTLAFLTWLVPLIRLGSKTILDTDDLLPLDSQLRAEKLAREFEKRWHDPSTISKTKKRSLALVLSQSLFWSLVSPIPSRALMLALGMCQPFFIQSVITCLESKDKDGSHDPASQPNTALGLILASILIYGGIALACTSHFYLHRRMQTRARGYLVTAIFRQATFLASPDASVLTLMSTDTQRIEVGLQALHELWANVLEVALAAWLLYRHLGPAFAAPFGVVALSACGVALISRRTGGRMARWMGRTEARVKLTSAVVAHMKPLKIAGWTGAVAALLLRFRADELRAGAAFRVLVVFAVGNAFLPQFLAPVAAFVFTGRTLSMAEVFASLSYLSLITAPLSQLFQRVPAVLAALSSLRRIQDFLHQEPREEYRIFESGTSRNAGEGGDGVAISLENVKIGWAKDKWQLEDLTLTLAKSQLTIITGPVAAGKSTFCKALLGEAYFVQGPIRFYNQPHGDAGEDAEPQQHPKRPRIGYCDQTAFLTTGSIRSNIIGFQPFNGALYDEVLDAVLLRPDLASLPRADETEVGSAGVTLSGGQRQRVALARALCLETEIYVLDDFTVGLDSTTAAEVVRRLFKGPDGFLRNRQATVVWCTHTTRFLPLAQHVVALNAEGRIFHQGPPAEVLTDRDDVAVLSGDPDDEDKDKDEAKTSSSDEELLQDKDNPSEDDAAAAAGAAPPRTQKADRDPSRALNGAAVYYHYFSSFGAPLIICFLSSAIIFITFLSGGPVWLKFWADNTFAVPGPPSHIKAFYLGIYAGIESAGVVFLTVYIGSSLLGMALVSGTVLHRRAVQTLLGAPLRFLTATDQGVVLNLFSQDMNLVDTVLPPTLFNTVAMLLWVVGQAVVVAIGTPPVAAAYPLVAVVLYGVARGYLRTSRQLRLLELENKSPLYAQFQDTVRGIASIRALGWVGPYTRRSYRFLDDSQRPLYLLEMCSIWLNLVLKFIAGGLAVAVTVLATQVAALSSRSGLVGAGFVSLMLFGELLNAFVQSFVQLETSLGAVKRLRDFGNDTGTEDRPGEDYRPDESWPEKGAITMQGVDASYQEQRYRDEDNGEDSATLTLRNISLNIQAGEKVGLVGRTGSGKSSLILLLLRLLEPTAETETSGQFTIDRIPLCRIHRDTLRQRLIAVPQDMIFLAAGETFKAALDPYERASDEECQSALDEVGLLPTIEEAGGLHVAVGKDKLSHGQKQLFSLAIAVLRARARQRNGTEGGVLLLDEVTSNVDWGTEKTIMDVVATVFQKYTVLAVTHSLESVAGFDRVVEMADGQIISDGTATSLIQERNDSR